MSPKANNKDTTATPMASFWCLHCQPRTYPTHCSSASIANSEHAIDGWVFSVKTNIEMVIYKEMIPWENPLSVALLM